MINLCNRVFTEFMGPVLEALSSIYTFNKITKMLQLTQVLYINEHMLNECFHNEDIL